MLPKIISRLTSIYRGCYCNVLCSKVDQVRHGDIFQEGAEPLGVEDDVMLCCHDDQEGSGKRESNRGGRNAHHTLGAHLLSAEDLHSVHFWCQVFHGIEIKRCGIILSPLIRRAYTLVRGNFSGPAELANDQLSHVPLPSATAVGTASALATVMSSVIAGNMLSSHGLEKRWQATHVMKQMPP